MFVPTQCVELENGQQLTNSRFLCTWRWLLPRVSRLMTFWSHFQDFIMFLWRTVGLNLILYETSTSKYGEFQVTVSQCSRYLSHAWLMAKWLCMQWSIYPAFLRIRTQIAQLWSKLLRNESQVIGHLLVDVLLALHASGMIYRTTDRQTVIYYWTNPCQSEFVTFSACVTQFRAHSVSSRCIFHVTTFITEMLQTEVFPEAVCITHFIHEFDKTLHT